MYSTHNAGKSIVAQRFIRTLKIKIYKLMTWLSKNVYIDNSSDIVGKYNSAYHGAIKLKSVDVESKTYINFNKENSNKDPKFKFTTFVKISKYKKFFAKVLVLNWSKEVFIIKKVKNTMPRAYLLEILNGEKTVGTFYEKELQKANIKSIEKVIKRKVINYMSNGKIISLTAALIKLIKNYKTNKTK